MKDDDCNPKRSRPPSLVVPFRVQTKPACCLFWHLAECRRRSRYGLRSTEDGLERAAEGFLFFISNAENRLCAQAQVLFVSAATYLQLIFLLACARWTPSICSAECLSRYYSRTCTSSRHQPLVPAWQQALAAYTIAAAFCKWSVATLAHDNQQLHPLPGCPGRISVLRTLCFLYHLKWDVLCLIYLFDYHQGTFRFPYRTVCFILVGKIYQCQKKSRKNIAAYLYHHQITQKCQITAKSNYIFTLRRIDLDKYFYD